MSANVPTDICFSFSGLMERGGRTGPHKDGWGVAFYEGKGCRTFLDPTASIDSEIAKLVKRYSIKSRIVVCHIRKATHGKVCLENTHPFVRELWGRSWTFAHNGKLPGIKRRNLGHFRPVGTTDSEYAFCWMMEQIRRTFPKPPAEKALAELIAALCRDLDDLGIFNCLLTDSRRLYAYCGTNLAWITRKHPFGEASLIDTELTVDFESETQPGDVVTVVATRPLTENEEWTIMKPGSLAAMKAGKVITL